MTKTMDDKMDVMLKEFGERKLEMELVKQMKAKLKKYREEMQ